MKRQRKYDNVISYAGFARMKSVGRNNVQQWIETGRIVPVQVGDRKMIDLSVYADFDPGEIIPGPLPTLEGLQRRVIALEKANKLRDQAQ